MITYIKMILQHSEKCEQYCQGWVEEPLVLCQGGQEKSTDRRLLLLKGLNTPQVLKMRIATSRTRRESDEEEETIVSTSKLIRIKNGECGEEVLIRPVPGSYTVVVGKLRKQANLHTTEEQEPTKKGDILIKIGDTSDKVFEEEMTRIVGDMGQVQSVD